MLFNVKSKTILTALFIFALALAYRSAYLADYTQNPFFDYVPPAFDQYSFDQGARSFAQGDWLARGPNNQYSPIYKYFLGSIYRIFGRDFTTVFFIQFVVGSLSATLVFLIGIRLFGYWVGLLSATAFSVYGPNLFYEGILLREFLVPFFALCGIYSLILLKENPTTRVAVICGVSLSLFLQNRPNVAFTIPLLFFFFKDLPKDAIFAHAKKVVIATFLLTSIPMLIQCALVHKRFVFYDDSGPITLLTGNVTDFPGSEWTITPIIQKFLDEKEVTYANVAREIIGGAMENPVDFLMLYARKTYFLFHGREAPSNLNYYLFQRYSPLLRTPWSIFSLFSSLGVVGMIIGLREFRRLKLLYIFFVGVALSMILVYVPGRFRPPLVPIMMLFAFYALSRLIVMFRERRMGGFSLFAILPALLFGMFQWQMGGEIIRGIDYVHLGEAYGQRGETGKALTGYKIALKLNPLSMNAFQGIFSIYEAAGIENKALKTLEDGFKRDSSAKFISHQLANLYLKRGEYQKAGKVIRRVLDHEPENARMRNNLAVALIKQDRRKEAVQELERALNIQPDLKEARTNLEMLTKGAKGSALKRF